MTRSGWYLVCEAVFAIWAAFFLIFLGIDLSHHDVVSVVTDVVLGVGAVFLAALFRRKRHALPDPRRAHPRVPSPPG